MQMKETSRFMYTAEKVTLNVSIGLTLIISIFKKPIHMVRSAFQYMYDAEGHTFLDAYNNIPHVGHSHPKVVEAGKKQMAILNTNTRYLFDELAIYAERLLCYFPSELNKVFFKSFRHTQCIHNLKHII